VETSSVAGYANFRDVGGQTWAGAVADGGDEFGDDDASLNVESSPVGFMCDTNANKYDRLSRGIFLFDTSGLPDACTIIEATLYIYGSAALNEGSWNDTTVNIYSSAPALDTAVVAGDYDSLGSTPFSDTGIAIGSWSTTGYNSFAFNASGLAAVSTTDITKLGARTSYDVSGTDPGWSTGDALHFGCYFAENAGTDKDPMLVVTYGVQVSDISSGVHTVKAYADGTNLGIIIDEGEAGEASDTTALSGASVTDNANDWVWMQNDVMPYATYLKMTVSDTLIAWYQPIAMITATTLPDRQGAAENGTITWGSNSDMTVTMGSVASYESTEVGAGEQEEISYTAPSPNIPSGWFAEGDVDTLPFYDNFLGISTETGIPVKTMYVFMIFSVAMAMGFGTFIVFKPMIFGFVVTLAVLWAGSSMGIIPGWVIFSLIVVGFGVIYMRRNI